MKKPIEIGELVCLACFRIRRRLKKETAKCLDCFEMDQLVKDNKIKALNDDEGEMQKEKAE